jgi:hypothetical protein
MNYYIQYIELKVLVRMALAPYFTPGGLQISLNAYGDNRSNNSAVKQPGQRITAENAKDYLY